MVRLKHNPSILNEPSSDRATVTTDPSGVGKACKASGSVLTRALLVMVNNPASLIRNTWMKKPPPEIRREDMRRREETKEPYEITSGKESSKEVRKIV